MATAAPLQLPTAQMDEAKPSGATPLRFLETATPRPETPKPSRAEPTATTSMRAFCGLEKTVGTVLYRNILRECGRVNQPKLIRDPAVKRTVLQMLESAARGFTRLEAVTKRLDAKTVEALLAKLQAPPLGEISDMKTLQHVVFGLEELAGPNQPHAA